MGSDSQEKVERKRSVWMRMLRCGSCLAITLVVINVAFFKGKMIKKLRKEVEADLQALRGSSGDEGVKKEEALPKPKRWDVNDYHAPKPNEAVPRLLHKDDPNFDWAHEGVDFDHKKPLNHDMFDELYMEQEMIDQGLAPPDKFHAANHIYLEKIKHHADTNKGKVQELKYD